MHATVHFVKIWPKLQRTIPEECFSNLSFDYFYRLFVSLISLNILILPRCKLHRKNSFKNASLKFHANLAKHFVYIRINRF
jgi:hypothetical protein